MKAFGWLLLRLNCDNGSVPKRQMIKEEAGALAVAWRAHCLSYIFIKALVTISSRTWAVVT